MAAVLFGKDYFDITAEGSAAKKEVTVDDLLFGAARDVAPTVYAVRRPGSERASDVLPTQREALERAKELEPNSTPTVERVRNTDVGHPDKWRTP